MTETDIQNTLWYWLKRRGQGMIIPNVYIFDWESDLFSVSLDGYITEYEIKISRGDFKNDASKTSKHEALQTGERSPGMFEKYSAKLNERGKITTARPSCYWYVCPTGMLEPDEMPDYAGLMWVEHINSISYNAIRVIKKAPRLHRNNVTDVQIAKVQEALYWKYWRLRLKKGKAGV